MLLLIIARGESKSSIVEYCKYNILVINKVNKLHPAMRFTFKYPHSHYLSTYCNERVNQMPDLGTASGNISR